MNTYKALIVEDRYDHAKSLENMVKKLLPEIEICSICGTLEKAKKEIEDKVPQLLFLDIDMGGQSIFDMLKNMPSPSFKIIFVTGMVDKENMQRAIRESPVDYLFKPYSGSDLVWAVKKAIAELDTNTLPELTAQLSELLNKLSAENNVPKILCVVNEDGEHNISLRDILYVGRSQEDTRAGKSGKSGSRILFRLRDGKSIVTSKGSILNYAKILSPFKFLAPISSSHIINMNCIGIYQKKGGRVVMQGYSDPVKKTIVEKELVISTPNRKWFDDLYNKFIDKV